MKRWMKLAASLLLVAAVVALLGSRLYIKSNYAHLTVDGRVTDDFKLYFGPGGKLLLRIGAKQSKKVFLYSGHYTDGWADECPPSTVLFPPFVAMVKGNRSACVKGQLYMALSTGNSLKIYASDGHEYEVTWQAPPR